MFTKNKFQKLVPILIIVAILFSNIQAPLASAQGDDGVERQINAQSGKISFIGPENGRSLSASRVLGTFLRPQDPAMALAKRYAPEFGVKDPERDLSEMKNARSEDGRLTVHYQQNYNGIPVMGGELIVSTNDSGDLYSMSGEVSPYIALPTQPRVDFAQAVETALQAVAKQYQKTPADFVASEPELWIFDESLLQPSTRPVELVWRMDVTAKEKNMPVRELVLVNAERGSISLHFNQVDTTWGKAKVAPIQSAQDDNPPKETFLHIETPIPNDTPASTTVTSNVSSSNEEISALSTTRYVATTGSDANSCSTPASPCLTIGQAVWKAVNGDTILVASGTYTGTASFVVGISENLTISGGWDPTYTQQSGETILDGQNARQVIYIGGGTITLDRLTITNGSKLDGDGGGIYFWASDVTIKNSIIKSNKARNGGGIYLSTYSTIATKLTLINSTISGNEATLDGGGIGGPSSGWSNGTAIINNSTIADNKAVRGGGIRMGIIATTLNNSILARNSATDSGNDCYLGIGVAKNSIIQDANCNTGSGEGYIHVDPMLSPILFGSSQPGYYTINTSSAAVDGGDPATCLAKDQRGVTRPQGAACDIGSYEFTTNGPASSIGYISGSNQKTGPGLLFETPLAVYAADSTGAPVEGVSIQFDAPLSGASGTFTGNGNTITVLTDSNGIAEATFTANSQPGTYDVTASASGLGAIIFTSLTNTSVWYVSSAGNNANTCNIPASPCLTIDGAIGKATAGDIIKVTDETYIGIGSQVVNITKNVLIYGGWNSNFETRASYSTIDAENVNGRRGIFINNLGGSGQVVLDRFIIQNANLNTSTNGGGIYIYNSNMTLKNSLIRNNDAADGAGIYASRADLVLNNITFSGNIASSEGGGLYFNDSASDQALTINNSTIVYNEATEGGGVYLNDTHALGKYEKILNSIIAKNTAITGTDCRINYVQADFASHNILGNATYCNIPASGYITADPLITTSLVGTPGHHALLGASPAVDAGDPATCLATDQRGIARPQGDACDIGAYERMQAQGTANLIVYYNGGNQRSAPSKTFAYPLAVSLIDSNGDPIDGVDVTFTAPASGASGTFAGTGNVTTVTSEGGGIAKTDLFTSNTVSGAYNITANASEIGSVSFNLENVALYVSRSGADTTNCSSPSQPCYSINYALSQAVSEDQIFVTGEVYNGMLSGDNLVNINDKNIILSGGWNQAFTAQTGQTILELTTGRGIYVGVGRTAVVDRFDVKGGRLTNNFGGGVLNSGSLTFTNGAIYNNSAHHELVSDATSDGGGIYSNGTQLTLTNVTISNNEGDVGGGLFVYSGNTTLNNVTITQNFATNLGATASGGGIENKNNSPITITNSIIAGNAAEVGQDCHNALTSGGNNLIGFNAGCDITPAAGDKIGTQLEPLDAMLGDLGDNSSSTKTHALLTGSPAIDAGNPATCASADQRGIARPQGAVCDIGAFEGSASGSVTAVVKTYTANNDTVWPGTFLCDQTDPFCALGDTHAKAVHKYAIGTYNLYLNEHGRSGIDDNNMPVISTVRYASGYGNAFWSGAQMVYGDGYGFPLADDVVAHELTHGVTQYESSLFYYYQSGAINESLSDVFGEYYDQVGNVTAGDTSGVKWLIGEDVSGLGAHRSMSNPPTYGDPDKMSSPNYYTGDGDSGGVHYNSGINNKAVYLMVAGGTFNGRTVTILGWDKTSAIYYEVNTNLLTSGADYFDLYYALQQACINLIGQQGITPGDCAEVKDAIDAVEMNKQPTANFNTDAPLCDSGGILLNTVFFDDMESGADNWEFGASVGTTRWQYDSPYGPFAYSGEHMLYANDSPAAVTDTYVRTKNAIQIPSKAFLHFSHAFGFDNDSTGTYDGGVLEYSTNNGSTWQSAGSLFVNNGYNGTIKTGYGNPLAGKSAFVKDSHGYISSRLNLQSLASKSALFRWRMGLDSFIADWGWWLDDVQVYTCGVTVSGNAGVAGVTLNYVDGTPKTATADGSGDYSIIVPKGWTGTVTPTGSGFTFMPVSRSYSNLQSSQTAQDYTAIDAPIVLSSVRVNDSPTSALSVDYTVTFSETVTNVDMSDFALTTTGLTGTTITEVSGSGAVYTVTVDTGSGSGTIRLDVVDDDSIRDASDNPLGGTDAGNGDFTGGEIYEVNRITILSTNTNDGWILESTETSNTGGALNKTATTLRLGDDAGNRQYRAILSFDIPALPEGATITSVTLKFKYAGKTGTLPFSTHGNLLADIYEGAFKGNPVLQLGDFSAKGTSLMYKSNALVYTNTKVDDWYSQSLNPLDFGFINNLGGVTQFRLRFSKDDNNDFGADFLKLYSGNAGAANRPQLIIEYVP
jgi:Zn-dependent metalloprotease